MNIIEDLDLTDYNAYRIHARCKRAYFPTSEDELIKLYAESPEKLIVLGNGNNVILSKEYYEESFVVFNGCFESCEINDNVVVAEAGATLRQLSEVARDNSLTGFETFYDIPSSVGGAVVMNAGAGGEEIKDILLKVRYLDTATNEVHEMSKDKIGFEYRNSFFQKKPQHLVLKAWFKLKSKSKDLISDEMETKKATRWGKQPRDYPNCGSVYKRPPGRFVGPMLDELGLKGYSVGGAEVSKKHSGFIINKGSASGEDILAIINHTKKLVLEKFNVDLEVEQRII